jgi:hypothetical protein
MKYESGRALDDQPLAAYGGSGMDLTATDEARIEAETESAHEPEPPSAPEETPPPPGAFAHATPPSEPFDDSLERPAADRPALVVAEGLVLVAKRGVTLLRTSRIAAGAAFGGVLVVGLLMLLGGTTRPGAANADASPTAAPVVVATREPGNATLVLTGKVEQTLSFAAMTGAGAPSAPIAVTWTDTTTGSLTIEGGPDRGTRTTGKALVLNFTVMVKDKPVTFTSSAGECTIGMALNSTNVSGTFTCRKLESDDGKYVVGATGSYRT